MQSLPSPYWGKGGGLGAFIPEIVAIAIIGVVVVSLTLWVFRKRLD